VLKLPVLRWGQPYASLEHQEVTHFLTGEPIAQVSLATAAMVRKDLHRAAAARGALRALACEELIGRLKRAGELYLNGTLTMGDGRQGPEEFARAQSASTGLPVRMCRANMEKNHYVLSNMDRILAALTRRLDLSILSQGYGVEDPGVMVSYQAQTPALGLVLPSNSPGVHTLWLPVIPMQIGLVLKPGPQEPWTPYRMTAAFIEAGVPAEAISIYPGEAEVGQAVLQSSPRCLIFGSTQTVETYRGNPAVQVHGPGFSKILLGDDVADHWEDYLELMVESVFVNSGRGCINASGIWVPRHGRAIAEALAARLGPVEPRPPEDPEAALAAFTLPGQAQAIWAMIEQELREPGVRHATEPYGPRLIERERCAYLRPVVVYCSSPEPAIARREYLFPFVAVVECPQARMIEAVGPTLVATAITEDAAFERALLDAPHVDRLNLGPIPTTKLDWHQPHEGNIVEFLFRARALQRSPSARSAAVAPRA